MSNSSKKLGNNSKKLETNNNKLENKKNLENRKSSIISLILTLSLCLGVSIIAFNIRKEAYIKEHRYDDIEDGYILLPGNLIYAEDSDMLKQIVESTLTSKSITDKTKDELKEYLSEQDYDYSFIYEDELNTDLMTENEKDNYIEFLKEQGILGEEYTIETSENGLSTINGKRAVSYQTLHEAESAFGTNLGLYTYIDCLENYEMINAYTVGDDFLQCVYAINQDGTMINSEQNIEESDIRTITVKLSTTLKADELVEVYSDNEYKELSSFVQEGVQVELFSRDNELVNLAYCNREDNRTYVIHCADGIEEWKVKEIFNELFNNLYLDSLNDEQKQLYLDSVSTENTWYNKIETEN